MARKRKRRSYSSYIVKVRGNSRLNGEYAGGKTLSGATKEARSFLPILKVEGGGSVSVVRYDMSGDGDGRLILNREIKEK